MKSAMKTEPKIYGPEVPGYAQLNEALRRAQNAIVPTSKRPKRKGKSQPDEKPA